MIDDKLEYIRGRPEAAGSTLCGDDFNDSATTAREWFGDASVSFSVRKGKFFETSRSRTRLL